MHSTIAVLKHINFFTIAQIFALEFTLVVCSFDCTIVNMSFRECENDVSIMGGALPKSKLLVGTRVGLNLNFEFESAYKLVVNLNVDFQKSMNLNVDFCRLVNLNV